MPEKKLIKFTVDNREIEAMEGDNLLQTCLDNDIYIPNLCFIKGMERSPVSCRLCFVEIEGKEKPLPSCTIKVKEGMVVKTDTQPVRQLQVSALKLLLSVHQVDCRHCPANKKCELQKLAKILKVGLKSKQLEKHLKEIEIDKTHPCLDYYPNRCVLCGKCVYICNEKREKPLLTFAKRGLETVISLYGAKDILTLPCEECHECVDICPVSAITLKISH